MDEPTLTALRYPKIWPPPQEPPCPQNLWSSIPVLGLPLRWLAWLRHSDRHRREILEPIEREIISQLTQRPTHGDWPVDEEQRQLAQIVSDAVKFEKGLSQSPALHPDDPYPLLMWGSFDDWTPLIIRNDCETKLKFIIPENVLLDAWNERWTIRHFIEECLNLPSTRARKHGLISRAIIR